MEISNFEGDEEKLEKLLEYLLEELIKTMGNVALDFWDDFRSEIGNTDELHQNHKLLEKLTQFQHYAEHKRTSKIVQSYKNYNSMISLEAHDQGMNAYTCWAFSAASMIRNSCRVMIENLKKNEIIDGLKYKEDIYEDVYDGCIRRINYSSFHVETRNAILMILVPRQLHVDDESQAAFLRPAVSRLANATIIDNVGIFYLDKVEKLISIGLELKEFPVNVTYKTYYNSYHPGYITNSRPLIDKAVAMKLCPVAAVDVETIQDGQVGHGTHAMVLDTIRDGRFVFKNTYADNKRVEIPVEKGPLEFYFVHIELNEYGIVVLRNRKRRQLERTNCWSFL